MEKIFTHPIYKFIIAIFCCVLWGSAFPTLKVSYEELGILPNDTSALIIFAGMRFFLASLLLLILLALKNQGKILTGLKHSILPLILIGFIMTTMQYFFFYNGLVRTPGSVSSILNSLGVFFTVILSHIFFKDDKINFRKIIGIFLGFTGVFIINQGGVNMFASKNISGELMIIIAGFSGSIGTIFVKLLGKKGTPLFLTAWQMFFGSILLLVIGIQGNILSDITITPTAIILYIYSALLSATAFTLWNYLFKYNKSGEIGLFKFAVPVSGSILSILFLPDEKMTIFVILALLFISTGTMLVNIKKK